MHRNVTTYNRLEDTFYYLSGLETTSTKFAQVFFYYYYLICEAIGTAATPGLLCQPRVIMKMIMEKQMKCRLAGKIEILGENLPQRHFCPSQNPT
jgi:hypothetical protein